MAGPAICPGCHTQVEWTSSDPASSPVCPRCGTPAPLAQSEPGRSGPAPGVGTVFCWRCGSRNPVAYTFCGSCGVHLRPSPSPGVEVDSGFGRLIPTRNPAALAGYYLGVFSLIPVVGVPLGIAAVICGILGLSAVSKRPEIRGRTHALVAIILGTLTLAGHAALIAFLANS